MKRHFSLWLRAACVSVLAMSVFPAFAQTPIIDAIKSKDQAEEPEADAPDIDAKREEAAAKLRVAQRELDSAKAVTENGNSPPQEMVREVDLRDQIERVLAQQKGAERRKKELEETRDEIEKNLDKLRNKQENSGPAKSFLLVDELRDNLTAEVKREGAVRAAVNLAGTALERAKSNHDKKESRRVLAKEAVATNTDQTKTSDLSQALDTAILESELAGEVVTLRRMELQNEKLAEEKYRLNITLLKEQVGWLANVATFDENDLQAQIAVLEKQSADLKRKLVLAEPDATFLEDRWFDVRRRAEAASEKSPELVEEVEARRLAYLAQQQRVAVLNSRIRRLVEMRTAWNRRYKVAKNEADEADRKNWTDESERIVEQLQSESRVQIQKSHEVRKKLAGRVQKAQSDDATLAAWTNGQQESLLKLSQTYELDMIGIEASLQLHEKLLAEMRGKTSTTVNGRLASGWQWLKEIWNYPVATVQDRPITLHKIVIGILILVLGFFASRTLSRMFARSVLTRLGVHESASSAIQTITYYVLVLFFILFALHVANVPLTAFTILGGALALGLGFGSQNVVSNFISGLILLAERPIRIGDLIQVDGLFAVVEKIGARSTRVKTGSNLEILVPNSKFLENNVTNWTLSSTMVRCEIQVGVVYGSPTKSVEQLLIKAAKIQEEIIDEPTPFVWFRDFGDNSLNFQLNFWINMTSLTRRLTIESQVRFTIDEMFRDEGIIIAFPQRDVHLDMVKPLEVRMLPPEMPAASPQHSAASDAA